MNGWGGSRAGAGRKPKGTRILRLHGGRERPDRKRAKGAPEEAQSAPVVAPEPVKAPEDLAEAVKKVWDELAPMALEAGTLTTRTMSAFVMLCRNVVLERQLAGTPLAGGKDHRGMLQWVASRFKDFAIAPFGKPVTQQPAAKPVDPFEEFDRVAQ